MFSCYAEQGNTLKESAVREKVRRGLRGPLTVSHLLSDSRPGRTSKCPKALNPERQSWDERRPSRVLWQSDFTRARKYTYLLCKISMAAVTNCYLVA